MLEHNRIGACWAEVLSTGDFERRRADAQAFNAQSRYRKRGIAITPTKFGISFTTKFLNQVRLLAPRTPHPPFPCRRYPLAGAAAWPELRAHSAPPSRSLPIRTARRRGPPSSVFELNARRQRWLQHAQRGVCCHRDAAQAGALVHVYLDGSVLVTHGGVEMGQGLHTKMAQVAAQVRHAPNPTHGGKRRPHTASTPSPNLNPRRYTHLSVQRRDPPDGASLTRAAHCLPRSPARRRWACRCPRCL